MSPRDALPMIAETEIIEAMKNDEFVFHYQPKVSLVTGKVSGAEALIRWIKPEGSVVMPDAFIPVAEQSSLIKDITRHMFPKLVNDLMVLTDVEKSPLSFNASARDFEDDAFARMMLESLETLQIPPDSLQVELTETAALEAGDRIRNNILPLRQVGLGLAMDDFGTGYSSLDTLSKWPFTIIKLDQGIIGRMLDSDKCSTIVESSIRMAHELGISIVAEGVENNGQYQHLLGSGCTKVQGFWISKAIPLDRYISFVKEDIRWSGMPAGLISMAIVDHVQWRKQLVSELVRAVSFPKNSPHRKYLNIPPLSCKECRLGLWYYGVGQMFKDRQSFLDMEKPHCEFHDIGILLVDLVRDGAGIEDLTPHLRTLSEHSMEILGKLQALEIEGLMDMNASQHAWISHPLHPTNQA
ncbi:MAG: EAL domain-containing protein [Burkholderiales bacterium]|nr:EAL domain-containing protein [Burkholderiales bacterium]